MYRLRLHASGVKLPKLGSIQDSTFRKFQLAEAKKELRKNTLLAYIAVNTPTFDDQSKAREWSNKVSQTWKEYSSLELGLEMTEAKDDTKAMEAAYTDFVKKLKPVLSKDESGAMNVTGLGALFKAHGEEPPRATKVPFKPKKHT